MNNFISKNQDKPCVFMPFLGEFGIMIYFFIKFVHFYKCSKKIVVCPKNERIFYPSADEFMDFEIFTGRKIEFDLMSKDFNKISYNRYIQISEMIKNVYPEYNIVFFDKYQDRKYWSEHCFDLNIMQSNIKFDIAIGSRKKQWVGNEKTFKDYDWDYIVEKLRNKGYRICIVGNKKFSKNIKNTISSWDISDDSTSACEMLKSSRLYLGTDCGISHLAAFLQIPTILIHTPESLFPSNMEWEISNTNKNFVKFIDTWNNPEGTVDEVSKYLKIS